MPKNPQPTPRPDAKTAIITGGARGIGLATAHLMHEDGWNIVLVDWDAVSYTHSPSPRDRG